MSSWRRVRRGDLKLVRSCQVKSIRLVRFGVLLLAGCRAALNLDDYTVSAVESADASVPVAERSDTSAVIHRADPPAPASDAGIQAKRSGPDAAISGNLPQRAADRDAAVSSAAGGTGAVALPPTSSEEPAEDAGADADGVEDKVLGGTGLRVSDILGYYAGDWGQMVLRVRGDEIWGAYEYRDGTIIGQVNEEGVFAGWWTQTPTRTDENAGEVEFRWSKIANTTIALDGRWRYGTDGEWLENWDIIRVVDRSAPSQLTDRFNNSDDFKRHP